ncbi:RING/U-box [Glarea lozoyensis ATCC 20868]|uniref:RING/U-box n=1 Tax=Glarea lozoyensis (strain ATCC 20868 / MF5171) TaxID=1116229 RepID=S3DDA6_GLAL2|nr:RING/U-box [Glarea lozoyensis ATCC 20868]EPE29976.1 RING/U-box [Glarea lozoyensis ATCC 20868]
MSHPSKRTAQGQTPNPEDWDDLPFSETGEFDEDSQDPSSHCPICYETYSEQHIQVPVGSCCHTLCQQCYTKMMSQRLSRRNPAHRCPCCREPMGQATVDFTSVHDTLARFRLKNRPYKNTGLMFVTDFGWEALQNKTKVRIQQYPGGVTETTMTREVSRKTWATDTVPPRSEHSLSCTRERLVPYKRELKQMFGMAFSRYVEDEGNKTHYEADIDISSFLWGQNECEDPKVVHTTIARSVEKKSVVTSGERNNSTCQSLVWITKVRERCKPVDLERMILGLHTLHYSLTELRIRYLIFVQIQMTIAACYPEIQDRTELMMYLNVKGADVSKTGLTYCPRQVYDDGVFGRKRSIVYRDITWELRDRLKFMPVDLYRTADKSTSKWYKQLVIMERQTARFLRDHESDT